LLFPSFHESSIVRFCCFATRLGCSSSTDGARNEVSIFRFRFQPSAKFRTDLKVGSFAPCLSD